MSKNDKTNSPPKGLPPVASPVQADQSTETKEAGLSSEQEREYQIEQETVNITATPPACPRCGSLERTPLKEIVPRLYNQHGCVMRYRTQCCGIITPIDPITGQSILDDDGEPKSYPCGNRYKVRKLIPGLKPKQAMKRAAQS